jgi:peptide/nickel transport system permease protein
MLKYTLKRVLAMIPVLLVISFVVFLIIYLTPGDPASSMLGLEASADQIAAVNESLGLNQPLPQRYLTWMAGVLHGDLGESYFMNMPVSQAIAEHFMPTLSLALLAEAIALVISIPCGIVAALRHGSKADVTLRVIALLGVAIPSFLMALILMWIFAVTLKVFPVAGYEPLSSGLAEHLRYLALPSLSLGCVQAALLMRMTRASVIEAMQLDCVKTARAKGVSEARVVWHHAVRNAALPILTSVGYSFGALLTGAVVTEVIFNIPGLGQLVTNSIERRDYPTIQGVLLVIALINSVINLLVDLAYGAFDPRARKWGDAR